MEKNEKNNNSTGKKANKRWEILVFHIFVDNFINCAKEMLIELSTIVNKTVDNFKKCEKIMFFVNIMLWKRLTNYNRMSFI